jgi:hypothetical protein
VFKKSPDELEAEFRNNPEAFAQAFESTETADAVAATWRARLKADGLLDRVARQVGFTYPAAIATAISLLFLVPYWVTGEFEAEWAVPWLAPVVVLPLMAWHANFTKGLRGWCVFATATVVSIFVAVLWGLMQDILHQSLMAQSRDLMMIHAPMLLLGLTGWVWTLGGKGRTRVDFVRSGVQVVIYAAVILAAGAVLFGLSMALADLLKIDEEKVAIHLLSWGLSGVLIFAHHVWLRHAQALDRVLPVIARLFIPLFTLLEAGLLVAYLFKGFGELSGNRDALMVFNFLLIAVIGLVLLHTAWEKGAARFTRAVVVGLLVLGIVADLIGMAAIGTRLWAWGFTPNRLTVLVGNVLFLGTLLALLRAYIPLGGRRWLSPAGVLNRAFPVYVAWTAFVVVLLPVICLISGA